VHTRVTFLCGGGGIDLLVPPIHGAKTCFLSAIQRGLSDNHPVPIRPCLKQQMCAGVYGEKFPNFCVEVLQARINCLRCFGWGACY